MDHFPLPLDVAHALVNRYGGSALDVARSRADTAQHGGDMKAHDHALMVLTEVEELVQELGRQPINERMTFANRSVSESAR